MQRDLFVVMRICSPVVLSYLDAGFEPRCGRKDFLCACCLLLLLAACCCLLKRVAQPWPLKGGVKPGQGKPSSVTSYLFPRPTRGLAEKKIKKYSIAPRISGYFEAIYLLNCFCLHRLHYALIGKKKSGAFGAVSHGFYVFIQRILRTRHTAKHTRRKQKALVRNPLPITAGNVAVVICVSKS